MPICRNLGMLVAGLIGGTGLAPKLVKKLGDMLIKKIVSKLDQVVGRVLAETSDKIVNKIGEHIRAQINLLKDSLAGL